MTESANMKSKSSLIRLVVRIMYCPSWSDRLVRLDQMESDFGFQSLVILWLPTCGSSISLRFRLPIHCLHSTRSPRTPLRPQPLDIPALLTLPFPLISPGQSLTFLMRFFIQLFLARLLVVVPSCISVFRSIGLGRSFVKLSTIFTSVSIFRISSFFSVTSSRK